MTTLTTLMLAASDSFAASILVKATAALAIALVAARLARRRRAAVRHVLLAAAFAVLMVLPLASISTAPWTVAIDVPPPVAAVAPLAPSPIETMSSAPDSVTHAPAGAPPAGSRTWSWRTLLVSVWAAGVVVLLVPMAAGLWEIRRLRRTATRWAAGEALVRSFAAGNGRRRSVTVVLHDAVSGPVTAGVARPFIALPLDAPDWARDDLARALAHELEHVRRADWLLLCLARITAAVYWCHPLVWIARHQLTLEAERACDDAVIGRESGASQAGSTAYAAQLVGLAARIAGTARPRLLAMAGRRDLATRVRAVLDDHQPRGRAGVVAVVVACAAAAGIALALSPLRLVAQVSDQSRPRYDAVTVKECPDVDPPPPTGAGGGGARGSGAGNVTTSPGHMTINCSTAEVLIRKAYIDGPSLARGRGYADFNNVSGPSAQDHPVVRGGPGWVRSAKYVVEATAPASADRFTLIGPMLQVLLEDRFKLKVRHEQEEIPLYALTVAKGGLKIKPAGCVPFDPANPTPPQIPQQSDKPPAERDFSKMPCGMVMRGTGGFVVTGVTLAEFAWTLSPRLDRAVVDRTGLKDKFNIIVTFPPEDPAASGATPTASTPGSPLFKAIEDQLGLTLEPTKGSNGYLVIESIQRPSADGAAPPRPGSRQ